VLSQDDIILVPDIILINLGLSIFFYAPCHLCPWDICYWVPTQSMGTRIYLVDACCLSICGSLYCTLIMAPDFISWH